MARKQIIAGTTATLATIVALSGIAAPIIHAANPITTIRPADLDTSQTRAAGHVTFRTDDLRVMTDDNTSLAKAAGYFTVNGPLPTSASLDWIGTNPQPGQQIVFDADGTKGNGNDYNVLVGEPVYGANWWLTNGSSADAKAADPSGADNGGNGSDYFGTLADWGTALPNARMLAGGFSLGSGIKGDGIIDGITYDSTTYRFTSTPIPTVVTPAIANVRGSSVTTVRPHGVRVDLRSQAQPANTVLGNKLDWKIKVDGRIKFHVRETFGAHDVYSRTFATGSGKHVVKVFKNDVLVRTAIVRA